MGTEMPLLQDLLPEAIIVPNEKINNEVMALIRDLVTRFNSVIAGEDTSPDTPFVKHSVWASVFDKWNSQVMILNRKLIKYGVKISRSSLKNSALGGYLPSTGEIYLSLAAMTEIQRTRGSAQDKLLVDMSGILEHELIHREQYKRGFKSGKIASYPTAVSKDVSATKDKSSAAYQDKAELSAYRNNQSEIMTWAHTIMRHGLDKHHYNNMDGALKYIRKIALIDAKSHRNHYHLNDYSPENRRKVVRLMVDYARELLSKKK